MENKLSFRDFKDRISIIQVATELGYIFDRKEGVSQPAFILKDRNGNEIDKIYIKNPKSPSIQGYWRRGATNKRSEKGDLIDFIKENLSSFPEAFSGRNEIDALNKILNRLAGNSFDINNTLKTTPLISKIFEAKPFNLDRYERENGNIKAMMGFFSKRNISEETVRVFAPFIELIIDKEAKYSYRNLGFPYKVPGDDSIGGYEIRGHSGYKGKAEGSNSTTALWIADFTEGNPHRATHLYFGESGYDVMSFYQVNKANIILENSVFFSTGGSFSENQLSSALQHYPTAKPVFGFDNDIHGKLYDIKAFCLLLNKELKTSTDGENITFSVNQKEFSIPVEELTFKSFTKESGLRNNDIMALCKAPRDCKDWNDVLLNSMERDDDEKLSRYDFLSNQDPTKSIKQ